MLMLRLNNGISILYSLTSLTQNAVPTSILGQKKLGASGGNSGVEGVCACVRTHMQLYDDGKGTGGLSK